MINSILFKKIDFFSWDVFLFLLYTFVLFVLITESPDKITYLLEYPYLLGAVGIIGVYRYSLWMIHFVRAQLYEKVVYAKLKKKIAALDEKTWMPDKLYFMIVSYGEKKEILYNPNKSIIHEAKNLNLPATICMGSASSHDEKIVADVINTLTYGENIKVIFVRQDAPNKRVQIAGALRSLVRQGLKDDDPVVFMDGDSIIYPGCLKKCLPVFHIHPDVHGITTNEKAAVINSSFLSNILNLRFAIRNFHMNSLSLSKKVLCLTGRFSMFRASQITTEEFIRRVENDYITDWFWQKIKFLSGDDKSTWYTLLKNGAKMLYVPDAYVYSIEKVKGSSINKYIQNLKRWSSNMLRNNGRVLMLSPTKTGFFTWFIVLDQRISMWTSIVSPAVILIMLFKDLYLAYLIIVWVFLVRYLQSLLLFYYGKTINWTFPLILYINQVLNGLIKVYMLFHLKLQRWNNQNVSATEERPSDDKLLGIFAKYAIGLYLALFLLFINFLISSGG